MNLRFGKRRRAGVELLEARKLLSGNLLYGSSNTITEYTPTGTAIRRVATPSPGASSITVVRDVTVDDAGHLVVFGNTSAASLLIYDPSANSWTTAPTVSGWNAAATTGSSSLTYGNLAAFGNYVYATDNPSSGSGDTTQGLIVFDRSNGYAATRFDGNVSPNDVAIGQDGKLYVAYYGGASVGVVVQVFSLANPALPTLDHSVTLAGTSNYNASNIAVDAQGFFYVAPSFGPLSKFDANGALVTSISPANLRSPNDISLDTDGTLAITYSTGIYLTNTSFSASSTPVTSQGSLPSVAFGTLSSGQPNTPASFASLLPPDNVTLYSGQQFSVTGSFADPDPTDIHSVTIDWGDGTPKTTAKLSESTHNFDGAVHTFPGVSTIEDAHTWTVTYDLSDSFSHTIVQRTVRIVRPKVDLGADQSIPEGSPVSLTPSVTPSSSNFTYSWNVTTPDNTVVASGTTPTVNFTPADNNTYLLTFTATTPNGTAGSDTATYTAYNVAPTATASSTYNFPVPEGKAPRLFSTVTDPSSADTQAGFTYAWTLTRNGEFFAVYTDASPSPVYQDDGNYVATVIVTDKDGSSSSPASTSFQITNIAPTISLAGPTIGSEGAPLSLSATLKDSPADTAAGFTINWTVTDAAQNLVASGTSPDITFTPPDNGTYTLTFSATDKDNATSTVVRNLSIASVAPTPVIPALPALAEGDTLSLTLTSTDPSPADTAAGFSYHWYLQSANGSTLFATGTTATVSYTFPDDGSYTLSVETTDKDGATASTYKDFTAANVAPTLSATGPAAIDEGSPYTLALAHSDPGQDTLTDWIIDWGDGSSSTLPGNATSATHTYADDGNYTLSALAHDEDNGYYFSPSLTSPPSPNTLTVRNVAPTPSLSPTTTTLTETDSLSLTASGTDPSPVDTQVGFIYSFILKRNDEFVSSVSSADPTFTFSPTDDGTYSLILLVSDKNGASTPLTRTFTVSNKAPTAVFSNSGPITEGSSASVSFAGAADSIADAAAGFTYAYDFNNDGVFDLTTTSASATVPASLTIDGPGSRTIRGRITDKDGASTLYSTTLIISNAPPAAKIAAPSTLKHNQNGTFVFSATDPSSVDTSAGFTYAIDWTGDGKIDQTFKGGSSLTLAYSYKKAGSYKITLWVTDKDGATSSTSVILKVT